MAKCQLPTSDLLRQLLRYEPETGKLYWLPRGIEWFPEGERRNNAQAIWNARFAGKEALGADGRGYKRGCVLKDYLFAHRVAWAIHYGRWPVDQLDHINGDKSDNRISNLREVTNAQNAKNTKRHRDNKSGRTGVFQLQHRNVWLAFIMSGGKRQHLGHFRTFEDACAARSAAERELGFHQNHGRS